MILKRSHEDTTCRQRRFPTTGTALPPGIPVKDKTFKHGTIEGKVDSSHWKRLRPGDWKV
jgi:hypothetical protein